MAVVDDAVLVAGGIGSRMLPATATVAKELLPLVDVPVLTHLAREAVAAGATRLHIIISPAKDISGLLNDNFEMSLLRPDIDKSLLAPFADVEVHVHHQLEPRGLGDAISCALHAIQGPFLVLLGDNLLLDSHSSLSNYIPSIASRKLVNEFERSGLPCVGLAKVEDPENYGVVEMSENKVVNIVEKPTRKEALSNLVLCGRYLFTSDTASLLDKYDFETHGELQSIAIQQHWMNNKGLLGVELQGFQWYDSGAPLPWLKGQIDHALRREDIAENLREWLINRLQR